MKTKPTQFTNLRNVHVTLNDRIKYSVQVNMSSYELEEYKKIRSHNLAVTIYIVILQVIQSDICSGRQYPAHLYGLI